MFLQPKRRPPARISQPVQEGPPIATRRRVPRRPGPPVPDPHRLRRHDHLPAGGDGRRVYFSATDATHGDELWRSDGTAAGTVLVKDINPGSAGSVPRQPDRRQRHAVLHGQRRHARQRAVEERRHRRRHRPGQGHQPRQRRLRTPSELTNVERHAVLRGRRRRPAAWSCGRATAPPPAPSWSRTSTPAPAGSIPDVPDERERHAVLRGRRRRHGSELWKSDGTAAGTVLVKDINPGSDRSNPVEPDRP